MPANRSRLAGGTVRRTITALQPDCEIGGVLFSRGYCERVLPRRHGGFGEREVQEIFWIWETDGSSINVRGALRCGDLGRTDKKAPLRPGVAEAVHGPETLRGWGQCRRLHPQPIPGGAPNRERVLAPTLLPKPRVRRPTPIALKCSTFKGTTHPAPQHRVGNSSSEPHQPLLFFLRLLLP